MWTALLYRITGTADNVLDESYRKRILDRHGLLQDGGTQVHQMRSLPFIELAVRHD
jgi:hypothetical protein